MPMAVEAIQVQNEDDEIGTHLRYIRVIDLTRSYWHSSANIELTTLARVDGASQEL